MSTPLTDAINALTTYANEITGKSDTNLPDAVRSLADGYSGGSSFYSGTYTPEQDTAGPSFDVGAANISHFLIYATTNPRRSGKKWFLYAHTDFSMNIIGIGSNNSGASSAGDLYSNSWFTKNGTVVTCASGVSGATTPGYFKAGITYQWFAW